MTTFNNTNTIDATFEEITTCAATGCMVEVTDAFTFCTIHATAGTTDKVADAILDTPVSGVKGFMHSLFSRFTTKATTPTTVGGVWASTKDAVMKINDSKLMTTIKTAAGKVVTFVKKHAVKSMLGFTAVAVAGMFTPGMLSAMGVGALMYQAGHMAYNFFYKKQGAWEAYANTGFDSIKYCFLGATATYTALWLFANVMLYAFYYVATVFIYAQYFILA